ncbi:hypothetical protein ASPBRDRAFT_191399 [Aspergillus brasiliensis CBS 101740]|uniref:Amidohydrolase-related domain-containing protein n=1 Tax=Aspergillus brasiliensis (strain CBS 101740 / IMI 381727 / IBT 21946) TaxID=767769 RepID=A0A1L9V2I4_ASPBC|nr:hypothetical protein ASPBRDRAFT_191399 [Aspergillus brasiliensis CBS 101740]
MPDAYQGVAAGIRLQTSLEKETAETIADDICKDLADDLQGMRRQKILGKDTVQVITVNTFFPPLPPAKLLEVVCRINDWMAEKTANQPQLIGTASIPPPPVLSASGNAPDGEPYMDKAIRALKHAILEQGLRGILIASNYEGVYLGDEAYNRIFALAEELNVPIIIHPAVNPVEAPFVPRKNIPTYSGYLNDQRTSLLDLVMSGVYEKHPNLTIIATHLGGGILTSLGRFEILSKRFPADSWYRSLNGRKVPLPKPISHYLCKIFYDCNNSDVADIMHAASIVGYGHLLTGTDYPWTDDLFTREVLGKLESPIKTDIAYNNAAKIFGYPQIPNE